MYLYYFLGVIGWKLQFLFIPMLVACSAKSSLARCFSETFRLGSSVKDLSLQHAGVKVLVSQADVCWEDVAP